MIFSRNIFRGGAPVPHRKNTAECATVRMGVPKKVIIPLLQHIGSSCEVKVKKGDYVKVGQVIGSTDKYVSAPVHSSVSGTVLNVGPMLYPGGYSVLSVEIEPDGMQEIHESINPPAVSDKKSFLSAIRDSGLVGLGGAGFPTHVKLAPPDNKPIDLLVVNGAECEPYITSDYREMMENPGNIIKGINIVLDALGIKSAIIGIEDNKPKAIKELSGLTGPNGRTTVRPLKSRYPQGAEKMLIYSLTGRRVPAGGLPFDVGIIVLNVNSVSFIAEYMETGMPLIKRRVTVDGSAVKNPSNIEALIGTQLRAVFEFTGGFKATPHKVLMGGPMMGIAQFSLETSVVKHTNALLAFDEKDARLPEQSACIRCGRCAAACPMNLLPLNINMLVEKNMTEELEKFNINDCIECGCCSYVCPAKRHLVQSMRLGKSRLKARRTTQKTG